MITALYSRSLTTTSVERKTIFIVLYNIYQRQWKLLCQYDNVTLTNKMFIHVAIIVVLFVARVQFPKSKSIAEVRSRYILSKEFGNWRNVIIVYVKQS